MKKYIIRIATIVAISILIAFNFAYAIDFADADNFITVGQGTAQISDLSEIGDSFTQIGNVLRFIGIGIVVAATAYMGILYMISPPEKQAKLKQQLIGLAVSAVVIFGGFYIWKIISTALDRLTAG